MSLNRSEMEDLLKGLKVDHARSTFVAETKVHPLPGVSNTIDLFQSANPGNDLDQVFSGEMKLMSDSIGVDSIFQGGRVKRKKGKAMLRKRGKRSTKNQTNLLKWNNDDQH